MLWERSTYEHVYVLNAKRCQKRLDTFSVYRTMRCTWAENMKYHPTLDKADQF